MSTREDTMRKVQALLDKAQSTTFDAERDSLLAKADALMGKWAIEEFELSARGNKRGAIAPELRDVIVSNAASYEVRSRLSTMFHALTRHVGCKIGAQKSRVMDDGKYAMVYSVAGWPADLDYLQMLFLNLQMHLLSKMEPKPDPSLSDAQNFAALREAGMDYHRIFKVMGWPWVEKYPGAGHGSLVGESATKLRTIRREYHKLCEREGRKPVKGLKAETYLKSFLDGYVNRINARLRDMAAAREEASSGKELVLADRLGELDEFFFGLFPDLRPHPKDCECETCHYMRCDDKECQRPRCVEWNKQSDKPVRYRKPREEKFDAHAASLGRDAANNADLSTDNKVAGVGGELL